LIGPSGAVRRTRAFPDRLGFDSPSGAESGLPQVSLLDFTATHPDPPAVTAALDALGVSLPITAGPVALTAEFRGPAGVLALS